MKEKGKIPAMTALVLLLLTLGTRAELCEKVKQFSWVCDEPLCIKGCTNEGYTGGYCNGWPHPGRCVCT
ncbi:hypothetical protein SETIT_2G359500v2 [Setaria italica]|uniref:Invertebrate defensins family profile domain-containing protein n=1 Tax=Setaria italica TaxID=4555 RepID=K4A0C5_SETIT|nr:hypothetical protein SETIT_2G359500v2 [Setaria italica]